MRHAWITRLVLIIGGVLLLGSVLSAAFKSSSGQGMMIAANQTTALRSTGQRAEPTAQPGLLFSDDFERAPLGANPPPGWTAVDGQWDGIVADPGHVLRHGQGAYGHVVAGAATWANYTVGADIKPTALGSGFAGVAARYQGPGDYYACGFYYATTVRLWRMQGHVMKLLDARRASVDPTRFHTVRLSVMGDRLSCIIDGTWLVAWTDGSLQSGRVGLVASDQETAEFDNVEVVS